MVLMWLILGWFPSYWPFARKMYRRGERGKIGEKKIRG